MRLRFDEGEGESHIDNNNNDTSNYTSYYDCAHNKEVEEEEVHDNGDKSPLLPSVAQYDNSCNDHHNDSDIDYDTENHNNNNNNHNNHKNCNDNHVHNDGNSHNQNNDNHNRNRNPNHDNDDEGESEEEEDEASVKTLLMESKIRSPYPRSSPHPLHTPILIHTYTPTHTSSLTHEARTELDEDGANSNNSKKDGRKCADNNGDRDEGKEVSSTMERSEALENVLKAEEHSSLRTVNNTELEKMSSKSVFVADEKVIKKEVAAIKYENYVETNKGGGGEGKEGVGEVFVTNMDEMKDGGDDSDSDCDTVPSPTLPPTLSTIPPSSAARKTLSMESRDPKISISRRVSRAPLTALAPTPVLACAPTPVLACAPAPVPAPAPTRPPRTSTQRTLRTQQSFPRPFHPMTHDMDYQSSGRSSGSESDDSSSGSNNSSSGEEFSMPSSMTLQDTIRQRSRNQHAESALHSRLPNVAKIKKLEEKEKEKGRGKEEKVEKSDVGSRSKDGCAMSPLQVRLLCICMYKCMYVCIYVCMYAFSSPPSLVPSLPSLLAFLSFNSFLQLTLLSLYPP